MYLSDLEVVRTFLQAALQEDGGGLKSLFHLRVVPAKFALMRLGEEKAVCGFRDIAGPRLSHAASPSVFVRRFWL